MRHRPSAPIRRALAAALLVQGLALGVGVAAARAADPAPASASPASPATAPGPGMAGPVEAGPSGDDLSARATAIADDVVTRWAALQLPDGHFPDPLYGGGGDYGTAMLGLAMARRGVANNDGRLLSRGLDAILAQATMPSGGAFELMTLARAERWGKHTLPYTAVGAGLWAQAEPVLAGQLINRGGMDTNPGAVRCYADSRCYNNLKVVSSLGELELDATGLQSTTKGALLAKKRLRTRAIERVATRIPLETGKDVTRVGQSGLSGGGLLSDPPRNPLAYHALSTMMLGELIDELGAESPVALKRAFDRASRALLLLAAPDGDFSYFGRGQGQVWVPAATADAAALAASRTESPALRGRYLALAEASLNQLRSLYGVGAGGLPLVPGAIDGATLAHRSIDAYATTRAYNGLAVDALDRAAQTLKHVKAGSTATTLPSARPGVVRSPLQGGIATITRGNLWAAVAAKSRAYDDARYFGGLLMMQRRDAAGNWAPIVPGRPMTQRLVTTLSVKRDGPTVYVPSGALGDRVANGVKVVGPWARLGDAQKAIDFGTTWQWRLIGDDTVEVQWRVKTARSVTASGLVGDGDVLSRDPTGFTVTSPDGSAVSYSLTAANRALALQRSRKPGGASAYDANLTVAQLTAAIRTGDLLRLRIHASALALPLSP